MSAAELDDVIRLVLDGAEAHEVAPKVEELIDVGDVTLVPRIREALGRALQERHRGLRDTAGLLLARIAGVDALPALLLAAAHLKDGADLPDGAFALRPEVRALLRAGPVAGRRAIVDLLRTGKAQGRRAVLLALDWVTDGGGDPLWAEAAADRTKTVRMKVVELIPAPATDAGALAVLGRLLRDDEMDIRLAAAGRLAGLRSPAAVAPLVAALAAAEPEPLVRSRIAYALGRLGDPAAVDALLRLLHDPAHNVRDQALAALGSVGGEAATAALLARSTDADPRLRAQCAKALAAVAFAEPEQATVQTTVQARLLDLAADPEPAVRAAVLSGLATARQTRPPGTPDQAARWARLVDGLAQDPDPDVRRRVAHLVDR